MVFLDFHLELTKTDPHIHPVLIVGQMKYLRAITWDSIRSKLEPRVSEEVFRAAVASLHPAPTDSCSLYLNLATVAALPLECSRHNTPSRAHALTRLVKSCSVGVEETVLVVCEKRDVYASAAAVSRAFPQYSRKTSSGAISTRDVTVHVEFLVPDGISALTSADLSALKEAARSIRLAAAIVDTPCNEMHVDKFLDEISLVGREFNIEPMIIRGDELLKKGLGGIHAVGRAATHAPALAVLTYDPPAATKSIAWVGKGIVYDTGGLSLKGKTAMPGMKRDCGGAAAVLGAWRAAVAAGFKQKLHAVFCLAENSIGPEAPRPDDIITLYSGKTVEVNNTDAEGRLVLSDGCAFAIRDLDADVVVDLATLTGAQGIATGKYHAAILSNRAHIESAAIQAGRISGDLVHSIPFSPELHFNEFASAVADMKNSVADRSNAQSSCAGLFVLSHLGWETRTTWLHVDMATPVHCGERATGYGVVLLTTLFGNYTNDPLLNSIAPKLNLDSSKTEDDI